MKSLWSLEPSTPSHQKRDLEKRTDTLDQAIISTARTIEDSQKQMQAELSNIKQRMQECEHQGASYVEEIKTLKTKLQKRPRQKHSTATRPTTTRPTTTRTDTPFD